MQNPLFENPTSKWSKSFPKSVFSPNFHPKSITKNDFLFRLGLFAPGSIPGAEDDDGGKESELVENIKNRVEIHDFREKSLRNS